MALNTMIAFIVASVGGLLVHADSGFMAIATSDAAGGRLLRRTMPPTIFLLSVLVSLVPLAENHRIFGSDIAVAVDSTFIVMVLAAISWLAARTLNREGSEQLASEAALRESEERFHTLVERIPGVTTIEVADPGAPYGFVPEFVSPQIFDLLGYTAEEWTADPGLWIQVVHPDDRPMVAAANEESLAASSPFEAEYRAITREGETKWIHEESFMTDVGGGPRWHGLMTDVTERKHTEELLRQREAAEEANRAKTEFLSRMSHELRTPLNAILGFGQLLEMRRAAPEDREAVTQILTAGHHLLDLIGEVLDISSIDAGRLTLSVEPVNVGGVIKEACDLVRPLAAERKRGTPTRITERFELRDGRSSAPPPGDAEPPVERREVQQALGDREDRVRGRRRCDRGEGDRHRIRHPEGEDHRTLPAVREARGGSERGRGNRSRARAVEVSDRGYGGELGASSEPDIGSTFWFRLPKAADAEIGSRPSPPHESAGPLPAKPADILYIEDNLANMELLQTVMRGRPQYNLVSAMTGQVGLDLARAGRPQVILLELHLPDIGGEEVLAELKRDARTRDIRVILISADATPQTAEQVIAAGARSLVPKPLDLRLFLTALSEALG